MKKGNWEERERLIEEREGEGGRQKKRKIENDRIEMRPKRI